MENNISEKVRKFDRKPFNFKNILNEKDPIKKYSDIYEHLKSDKFSK